MSEKTPLEIAQFYAGLGWSVVPLHWPVATGCSCANPDCGRSAGKHSLLDWKEFQTRHPTPEELELWFTTWKEANYGLMTGALSGVVVLDIDVDHGGDVGLEMLTGQYGELPEAPMVITGSGGRHYYFRHPGVPVKNKVNMAPGVDFRGDGGLIVLPPSMHRSGRRYEWESSLWPHRVPPPPLPDWLLKLLTGQPKRDFQGGGQQGAEWANVILHGAEEGSRNDTAARLAGMLFRKLEPKAAGAIMILWNRSLKAPLPDDELFRTLESIAQREAAMRTQRRRIGP